MSTTERESSSRVALPGCPVCRAPLSLGSHGEIDRWACPAGHGLAMTLSELHVANQNDEVAVLWQLARAAAGTGRPSPFPPHRPMARIELPFDHDEIPEGESGDVEDAGTVEVEVDIDQQFVWFDAGEHDVLPADLPDAAPSAEELARLEQIRRQFAAEVGAALEARDDAELTERVYRRVASRPELLRTLDRVGRTMTTY